MTADATGPCFHCELSPLLQELVKRYPNKSVPDITMELTELLADYIACTAPAGEVPSAILTIQRRFPKFVKEKRAEAIKLGCVNEVTVQ